MTSVLINRAPAVAAVAVAVLLMAPALRAEEPRVELLTDVSAIRAGDSFTAGIRITLVDGWHTYWINPGDAGAAPRVAWTLPEGITAGEIAWPTPSRMDVDGLVSLGYEREVTLLVPMRTSAALQDVAALLLRARVSVLVCKETCVPYEVVVQGRVRVADQTEPAQPTVAAALERALSQLPARDSAWRLQATDSGRELVIRVVAPSTADGFAANPEPAFFPSARGVIDLGVPMRWSTDRDARILRAARTGVALDSKVMGGVLVWEEGPARVRRAVEVEVQWEQQ
jgi:DsbC/DsbD-like thiol-disulfide interchange protein